MQKRWDIFPTSGCNRPGPPAAASAVVRLEARCLWLIYVWHHLPRPPSEKNWFRIRHSSAQSPNYYNSAPPPPPKVQCPSKKFPAPTRLFRGFPEKAATPNRDGAVKRRTAAVGTWATSGKSAQSRQLRRCRRRPAPNSRPPCRPRRRALTNSHAPRQTASPRSRLPAPTGSRRAANTQVQPEVRTPAARCCRHHLRNNDSVEVIGTATLRGMRGPFMRGMPRNAFPR